jgi:hypothetical protein
MKKENIEKMTDKEKVEILREQWLEEIKIKQNENKKNDLKCDRDMFKKGGSGVFYI